MFTVEFICYEPNNTYHHLVECEQLRVTRRSPAYVIVSTWNDGDAEEVQTTLTHYRVSKTSYNRAIVRNSAGIEVQVINTYEVEPDEAAEVRRQLGLADADN